jgi:hypothetical protein
MFRQRRNDEAIALLYSEDTTGLLRRFLYEEPSLRFGLAMTESK